MNHLGPRHRLAWGGTLGTGSAGAPTAARWGAAVSHARCTAPSANRVPWGANLASIGPVAILPVAISLEKYINLMYHLLK